MSVEFYVIMFTFAALLVGLIVKPRGRGQAETSFCEGTLVETGLGAPVLEIDGTDNGTVVIRRHGLKGLTPGATVALAVTRVGFDITIEERISPAPAAAAHPSPDDPTAVFFLTGLAPERYHISYNSDPYSLFQSFTISNRPDLHLIRPFPA